jgi:hypothetical protein
MHRRTLHQFTYLAALSVGCHLYHLIRHDAVGWPLSPRSRRWLRCPPGSRPANPRYFSVAANRRKAVYLTGLHIWNNSHDAMGSGVITFDRSTVASFRAPAEPSGPTVLYLRRVG